jgi:hypothetical protein
MMGWIAKLGHRLGTALDLLEFVGGKRPWMLPVLVGLLLMSGLVMLAQAAQISPFIYTLF